MSKTVARLGTSEANDVTTKIDLAALLAPTSVQSFVQSSWAKAPLLVRAERQNRFEGVLDLATFEFLLTSIATPGWLSFLGGETTAPARDQLTSDGTPNMSAILKAVNAKKSLLLVNVHRLDPRVGALCRQVGDDCRDQGLVLGKPVRGNAYFTPPHAQGLEPHYDDHDVLVLQLHGFKQWRIHHEVKWPRRPMLEALPREFVKAKPLDLTLNPGDVLYLPRGFVHEAAAMESSSLHLTLSVHAATWADVFERLVKLEDGLGEPLPVGFFSGAASQISDREQMARMASGMMQSPALNRAMHEILNRTLMEADIPAYGQLARIEADAKVEPDAWLVLAPGLSAKLEREGDVPVLRVPGEAFQADPRAARFFGAVSSGKPFRLCDLDDGVNVPALAVLAQQLMKRGILIVEPKAPPES
jgi:hypothetical protein